jgi:endogenous inhibitor of DNA gyrase (YacG/DUF329 family)
MLRKPKPAEPTRPCPACTVAVPVAVAVKICPYSGKGIVTIRLKAFVQGETRITGKLVACNPDEIEEMEGLEPIEIENPEGLPEREN